MDLAEEGTTGIVSGWTQIGQVWTLVRIGIFEGSQVMAASLAVTTDVLATANRVAEHLGRPTPFHVQRGSASVCRSASTLDCLVIPGLGESSRTELEAALASDDGRRAIDAIGRAEGVVASSCASTFLVAESGRLDGRRATTSWFLAPVFAQRYPAVRLAADEVVVEDGPILTGGAAMAQMDVMLRIVARFAGAEVARLCARYLLADARSSQAGYVNLTSFTASDANLAEAEQWVRENLVRGDMTVEEIAGACRLHPKTFYRRLLAATGLAPSRFVQRVRLEVATDLLRDTALSVGDIAARVGYADASTLRRILRRELGLSASEIRMKPRFAA
jgi:transcriptional regulator GlxA family with amidase domain